MRLRELMMNYGLLYSSKTDCTIHRNIITENQIKTAQTYRGNVTSATNGLHDVLIRLEKDRNGTYSVESPCKVDCNCPTYLYRNNEELYLVKSSMYTRFTKKPSKTGRLANPMHVKTICKHIYGYAAWLISKGEISR